MLQFSEVEESHSSLVKVRMDIHLSENAFFNLASENVIFNLVSENAFFNLAREN